MKVEASAAGASENAAAELRAALRSDRVGGESGVGPSDASGGIGGGVEEAGGFGAILEKTALEASTKEREADAKAEALADGRSDDLHGTMITMKEADISLKLVGSVRDKLMDAFHELWRINV